MCLWRSHIHPSVPGRVGAHSKCAMFGNAQSVFGDNSCNLADSA